MLKDFSSCSWNRAISYNFIFLWRESYSFSITFSITFFVYSITIFIYSATFYAISATICVLSDTISLLTITFGSVRVCTPQSHLHCKDGK